MHGSLEPDEHVLSSIKKKNWKSVWEKCSPEQLDNLALLRVMECTNGVIQHAFRDKADFALPIEETRTAMQFSMGAIKRLTIPLGDKEIKFEGWMADELRVARDLYIQGIKYGNAEAQEEFFACSQATVDAVGEERLRKAVDILNEHCSHAFPNGTPMWGYEYLSGWL